MDAMTTDYNFTEGQNGVSELESKLNAHLRDLCERNAQLSRRNADLLKAAEVGWTAEVQIKKFNMIEADLTEEIKGLHFEREMLDKQIRDKEFSAAQLKVVIEKQNAEIAGLLKQVAHFEEQYKDRNEDLSRRLAAAQDEQAKLNAEFKNLQSRHEQSLSLAQESFHSQLSDLAKVAWNAGVELEKSRAESARLQKALEEQDAAYRAQLTELAQSGWDSEREAKSRQTQQDELRMQIEQQRTDFEKTITELRRLLGGERNAAAVFKKRETQAQAEAQNAINQAKVARMEAQSLIQDKESIIAQAVAAKNAELVRIIEAKEKIEKEFEHQKSAVAHMSFELNANIRELKTSHETIQKQMTVIGDQSRALYDQGNEMAGLRIKLDNLHNQIGTQQEVLRDSQKELQNFAQESEKAIAALARAKDQEIEKLAREAKTKDEVIRRQLVTLSNMTKAEKEKDLELKRHRFTETSLNESVNELRRAGQERDELRKELEAHIVRLNHQILDIQAAAQDQLQAERDWARQMLNLQDTQSGNEKTEVLRRAEQLADEIRAATTLMPLKDYLALTECELGKVEARLRKTPVISIERLRLKASFNQMIDQRDFLKAAIANSQRQLEHQAAQLLEIARPQRLKPIPPPPPRKTAV